MPKKSELTKPMFPSYPIPNGGGAAKPSDIFSVKKTSDGRGTQVSEPAAAKAVKSGGTSSGGY